MLDIRRKFNKNGSLKINFGIFSFSLFQLFPELLNRICGESDRVLHW